MRTDAVLVVGVYLVDQKNLAPDIVGELSRSRDWHVNQQWTALGTGAVPDELRTVTAQRVTGPVAKFTLLNQMLAQLSHDDYEFIVVCDDDIRLPEGFLDAYLETVRRYDLALCQPARTHDSVIDHVFVECLDGLSARRTRFVEIGPLFSVRHDAARHVLPFDEASPMGWGYDLVWPCLIASAGLKMGIVDATPVSHSLRKPVAHYDRGQVEKQMRAYLDSRPHLSRDEAFLILDSYV